MWRGPLACAYRRSASLLLFGGPRAVAWHDSDANRIARMGLLVIASQRTRAKSRGQMTGSAKQSRAACDSQEAVLDCFVATLLAMTKGAGLLPNPPALCRPRLP